MPVILTKPDEVDPWLDADTADAPALQRPSADDALRIVAKGEKEDQMLADALALHVRIATAYVADVDPPVVEPGTPPGSGVALRPSMRGRSFFRVVFFIPLMMAPVGVAYMFRILVDMQKGPFASLAALLRLSWATQAWSARLMALIGDTRQGDQPINETEPNRQIGVAKVFFPPTRVGRPK